MKLDTTVSEIMSQATIVTNRKTTISEVKKLFHKYHMHHIPVIENNEVIGIISSNDILQAALKAQLDDEPIFPKYAEDIMQTEVISIKPDASIKQAADFFSKCTFHSLPVIDEKQILVGILTTTDLIQFLAELQ